MLGCESKQEQVDRGRKLAKKLSRTDAEERHDAAKEFEQLAERAADHVGVIGGALRDPSAEVRYRCAKTLSKMEEAAAPAVVMLGEALERRGRARAAICRQSAGQHRRGR